MKIWLMLHSWSIHRAELSTGWPLKVALVIAIRRVRVVKCVAAQQWLASPAKPFQPQTETQRVPRKGHPDRLALLFRR